MLCTPGLRWAPGERQYSAALCSILPSPHSHSDASRMESLVARGMKAASPPGLGNERLRFSLQSAFSMAPHHALHQPAPLSKRRGDKRQCVLHPTSGESSVSLLSAEDKRHHFLKDCCSECSAGRFCETHPQPPHKHAVVLLALS